MASPPLPCPPHTHLVEVNHESREWYRHSVSRVDACENGVQQTNLGWLCRHKTANVRQKHNQSNLCWMGERGAVNTHTRDTWLYEKHLPSVDFTGTLWGTHTCTHTHTSTHVRTYCMYIRTYVHTHAHAHHSVWHGLRMVCSTLSCQRCLMWANRRHTTQAHKGVYAVGTLQTCSLRPALVILLARRLSNNMTRVMKCKW